MSEARRIDFVLQGGTAYGMGHVVRSSTLACEARRRGWQVRAFVEGEPNARARWDELNPDTPARRWSEWQPWPATAPGLVALDYPDDKFSWLARVEKAGQRSLVIDDPRPRDRADWTLLPALHHESGAHHDPRPGRVSAARRLLAGPRYSIIPSAHLSPPETPTPPRTRLLLSMGGADPHHLTPSLAPLIVAALDRVSTPGPTLTRDVVLGPAFDDPGDRERDGLRRAGWRVHSALSGQQMAQLMRTSRLAVIGFGTSLGELAYHRTPFLTVTHHPHDRAPARDLEASGIGRVLGSAGHLDPARIEGRLQAALEDAAWQSESAALAYRMVEGGLGTRRIFDALEADLAHAPRAHPPATSGPPI